ncbi:MAG: restriction endonuclease, SacI family [Pseudomonadota bacterium]
MTIKFDKTVAYQLLEALLDDIGGSENQEWEERVKKLSYLCDEGNARTHIAFLGVQLLAKSLNPKVNLYYIKPTKAPEEHKERSYSARTLCEKVLVPFATKHDINLGVSGAEPLNNQPYFRMSYLDDGTPVHATSKPAWEYMLSLIEEVDSFNVDQAINALRAFLAVRSAAKVEYPTLDLKNRVLPLSLIDALETLVSDQSENGKRAQAATAGVLDAAFGNSRVDMGSGRINDPSRKRPGDVCILHVSDDSLYEKSFEVKDKIVAETDVIRFVRNAIQQYRVLDFGYLALASSQPRLDEHEIAQWAESRGASISLFYNWTDFVRQALFWTPKGTLDLANDTTHYIAERLKEIEASPEAVSLWVKLLKSARTSH